MVRRRCENLLWGVGFIAGVCIGALIVTQFTDNNNNNDVTIRIRREAGSSFVNATTNTSSKNQGIYPHDYIDLATRKKGAVLLHVFGMLYMFVALAIVCDEFFVPALEVITRRLKISDDVAGATFMAAGGSAPELFTSIIGVFLAKSNVGIGTIVGSAVFNILFVIGMCSLFSHQILQLTWWPLFRDCSFYILSLVVLIVSFTNSYIEIQESIGLMIIYGLYVTFMKFNKPIETWVKKKIGASTHKNEASKVGPENSKSVLAVMNSISQPEEQKDKVTFSYGIVQLMMHTLDPVTDEPSKERSSRLYAMARMKLISPRMARTLNKRGSTDRDVINRYNQKANANSSDKVEAKSTAVIYENQVVRVVPKPNETSPEGVATNNEVPLTTIGEEDETQNNHPSNGAADNSRSDVIDENGFKVIAERKHSGIPPNEEVEMSDMLDLSWPETNAKRCIYLAIAPIMYALWITLPDVRNPKREKWFMFSFFGSILWIAGFSYLMVWWAHQVGETIGFSEAVMGLTFLAAGTSVPDLITSVIVARKGLGDMAVSSSVGSNIFDVTIGLPFPWFVSSLALHGGSPIAVESKGLFCSILLLFAMLLFVVISIAVCKWKMSKRLGITMLLLYVVFLVLSLLLEFTVIQCPVTTG